MPEASPKPRVRRARLLLAGVCLAAALLVYLAGYTRPFRLVELKSIDYRFQVRGPLAPDPRIVLVSVGQDDLALLGPWPWPRKYHADLVTVLKALGARAVAFDILFSQPDAADPASDRLFAQTLTRAGDVVLGGALGEGGAPDLMPLPELARAAAAVGLVNVRPDLDGVYRRARLRGPGLWCMGAAAWGVWSGAWPEGMRPLPGGGALLATPGRPALTPPVDAEGLMLVDYPCGTLGWRWAGAAQVIRAYVRRAQGERPELDLGMFQGAVVLVGSTHPGMPDVIETPLGVSAYGVEFHAGIVNSLLTGRFLRQPPAAAGLAVYAGLALALAALMLRLRPPAGGAATLALAGAYTAAAFWAFTRWGLVLELARPLGGLAAAYLAGAVYQYRVVDRRSRELADAFAHYVSPEVVARLVREPRSLALGGELKEVTILFSDIRGFTGLAEGLAPQVLGELLNDYFTSLSRCVFREGGTLDKFIGDAVMVIYNAPLDQPDHAAAAARTALDFLEALAGVNARWAGRLGRKVGLGVGIHTGPTVVGNFGSDRRFNYTALGEVVNLASRLEGLTRHYGVDIVISGATSQAAGGAVFCRRLDRVLVKGASRPVDIHQVLAPAGELSARQRDLAARYEDALADYQARDFAGAVRRLESLAADHPDDQPARLLAGRAVAALADPPPSDWDGAYRFTHK